MVLPPSIAALAARDDHVSARRVGRLAAARFLNGGE